METIDNRILLSAKDVAMVIAYPGLTDGLARSMRQIRHWTQCDLIKTANSKHTGRGRSRLYEEEPTIFIAAMLMELSRFGITVDKMQPLSDWFYEDWEADSFGVYSGAITGEWIGYISIDWNVDPKTGNFGEPELRVFSDAKSMGYEMEQDDLVPKSSCSTILNVNQIIDRLNWDYINTVMGRNTWA
ncbi:MAG: hypothetical protein HN793_13575 [Rhodospirillaceae bacterium]|jgi:hypothetical protein|nr:hypothetical protein [Rhodospirillaceae bacterium]MBT5239236.1 hypothetical protein [Rhodospirillaceae bacterium]MBT5566160.1 hypothetical protein [Rhodospirillaceae bacterium]MBT6090583.1 hypothetical protein [Rhodospirillaceae bacterium]MBT7451859.1 hypothetical protein [Rhodospirillaceae bacterium]